MDKTTSGNTWKRSIRCNLSLRPGPLGVLPGFLAAGLLLWTSCTEEQLTDGPSPDGKELTFSVKEIQEGWTPGAETKASASGSLGQGPVEMEAQDGYTGKTLYLHTSVRQGITSPAASGEEGRISGDNDPAGLPQTRGTQLEMNNWWNRFSLFGYSYASTGNFDPAGNTPDYLYNVEVSRIGNAGSASYGTTPTYYLPGAGTKVMLFAMAPYSADLLGENTSAIPGADAAGTPEFAYKCPWYSPNQQDLCFTRGTEISGDHTGNINLNFYHTMTAVRVVAGSDIGRGTVKRVRLLRIPGAGIYTPSVGGNDTSAPGSWQITDKNVPSTQIHHGYRQNGNPGENTEFAVGNGQEVEICGNGNQTTFFMIPQTLPQDAALEVVYKPEGSSTATTITASLAGQTWKMGTTVTYRLTGSKDEPVDFDVTFFANPNLSSQTFPANAQNEIAFRINATKGQETLPVVIEYSYPGANPQWSTTPLAMFKPDNTLGGNAGTGTSGIRFSKDTRYPITVLMNSVTSDNPRTKQLRNAGTANNEWLGGSEGAPTTSNCYVVNKGGTYRFACAYGNALSNGSKVSAAMDYSSFYGYNGNSLNGASAWIDGAASALLLWQDREGMVSGVTLQNRGDGHKNIAFTVATGERLKEGNAIIGVRDGSGRIMWSWHIWILAGGLNGNSNNFCMKVPLGYVASDKSLYAARPDRKIRFRLPDYPDIAPIEFTINQTEVRMSDPGWYMLYQWGRKDPMRPGYLDNGTSRDLPVYGNVVPANKTFNASGSVSAFISASIQNPEKFASSYPSPYDAMYWLGQWYEGDSFGSINDNPAHSKAVNKTVYDPTPNGYCVASITTYESIVGSKGALGVQDWAKFIGRLSNSGSYMTDYGFRFSGNEVFIPMAGERQSPNFTYSLGGHGAHFWTLNRIRSQNQAYTLNIFMPNFGTTGAGFSLQTRMNGITYNNCLPLIPQKR